MILMEAGESRRSGALGTPRAHVGRGVLDCLGMVLDVCEIFDGIGNSSKTSGGFGITLEGIWETFTSLRGFSKGSKIVPRQF